MASKKLPQKNKHYHLLVLIFYIIITAIISFPLIIKPFTTIPSNQEEYFFTHLMTNNIHNFLDGFKETFNLPYFYPLKNTLAFADPMFTSSIISIPFYLLTNQPLTTYSINILFAFIFNAFFTYLLMHKLTKKILPSFLSGIIFSFSIGRIDLVGLPQLESIFWLPLGLLFLINFFKKNKLKYAIYVTLCFLAQILNNIFLGYVYLFTIFIFTLTYFKKKKIDKNQLFSLIKALILSIILLIFVFKPYIDVSKEYKYTRSIDDVSSSAAIWYDYILPSQSSSLFKLTSKLYPYQSWAAYLGFPITLLGLISTIYFISQRKIISKKPNIISLISISATSLIMSFGPYFHIIRGKSTKFPLPYLLAFYIIPGFRSMRVSARWSHLLLFSLSLTVGIFLSKIFKTVSKNKQILITILISLVVILEINQPIFKYQAPSNNEIPAVYHWLSNQLPSNIVELPAYVWYMPNSQTEIDRLHFHSHIASSKHQYLNGVSGFSPPDWIEKIVSVRNFPDRELIIDLDQIGIDFIVIHHNDYQLLYKTEAINLKNLEEVQNNAKKSDLLDLVYQDKNSSVYKIL